MLTRKTEQKSNDILQISFMAIRVPTHFTLINFSDFSSISAMSPQFFHWFRTQMIFIYYFQQDYQIKLKYIKLLVFITIFNVDKLFSLIGKSFLIFAYFPVLVGTLGHAVTIFQIN